MQCHISLCFFFCKSSAAVWPAGAAREERTEREKSEEMLRGIFEQKQIQRRKDKESQRYKEPEMGGEDCGLNRPHSDSFVAMCSRVSACSKRKEIQPLLLVSPILSINNRVLPLQLSTHFCLHTAGKWPGYRKALQPTLNITCCKSVCKKAAMKSSTGHLCNIKRMPAINILNLPSNLSGICD